jgi:hypothetical protein
MLAGGFALSRELASLAANVNAPLITARTRQEIFIVIPVPPSGVRLSDFRRPGRAFAVQARREAA